MRARTMARLAAALAVLVTLALALLGQRAEDDPPAPAHAMHERHRVELQLPPVEAALWFAARYPHYFTSGEAGLGPWLASLDPAARDFVLAMAQTLTWAWVEHVLAGIDAHDREDIEALARAATRVIRRQTLNQLEVNADHYPELEGIEFNAYVGAPDFAAGVFARLVRGVDNCEGQNHLLAVLLDAALESSVAGLPDIDAFMVGTRTGHELVRLGGPTLAQPIYVDAWSNLPAFTLDPARARAVPSLAELGPEPAPPVPGVPGRAALSSSIYAECRDRAIPPLSERDAPTRSVDLDMKAPALDEASLLRMKDPWKLYLFARILHIYDDPRAADLYRLVLARDCDRPRPRIFVCAASTALLERIDPREP